MNFCIWRFDHTGGIGTTPYNLDSQDGKKALFQFAFRMCQKSATKLGLAPEIVPYPIESHLPTSKNPSKGTTRQPDPNRMITRARARKRKIDEENNCIEETMNIQQMEKDNSIEHFVNLKGAMKETKWTIAFPENGCPKTYVLDRLLYWSLSINGRATVCWRGQELVSGRPQGDYVAVKRSFQDKGRASEKALIGDHGPNCDTPENKVSKYIVQILHSRDIRIEPFIDKRSFDLAHNELEISSVGGWYEASQHADFKEAARLFKAHERVCRVQVMSPLGYPLLNARSYEEAIRAIRDAVLGHKHAIGKHGVLHHDVSIGNIMIGVDEDSSTFGFLTDFDLAKHHESPGFAVATHRSRTMPYMSIPVLENCLWHTTRDDAESFFRVLLHICNLEFDPNSDPDQIKSLDRPVDSHVPKAIERCWNMPLLELAEYHRDKMSPANFKSNLGRLECGKYDEIRTLLVELHKIIFSNGTFILGHFKDPIHHSECDFDQMIKAFDKCRKPLKTRRQSSQ